MQDEHEGEEERRPEYPMEFAGRIRVFTERSRVAVQGHLAHLALQGRDDPLAARVLPMLQAVEDVIEEDIQVWASHHPVWAWAGRVKGSGAMVTGAVMSRCDITRVNTVSAMWAHYGFAPDQRRVKGEKLTYDAIGRTLCWRLGSQLLKANGLFKPLYDERKAYLQARIAGRGGIIYPAVPGKTRDLPDDTLGHVHNDAMRYMIKGYLACLWKVWREAEGLPIPPPYSVAILGHTTEWEPEKFADRKAPTPAKKRVRT